MSRPVLLAVAHGSRDPAAQATIHALIRRVEGLTPGVSVRAAFVSHAEPALDAALSAAAQEAGPGRVVIVPLLLSTGFHLNVDIHAAARAAGVSAAGPLGPATGLVPALADRLAEAGVADGTPIVLAAAGSSDPQAVADAARQAELLADRTGAPVVPAFASAAQPAVPAAIAELAERTGGPVAVATYLLAPGLFHDQLRQSAARWVSAPLGDHPAVAELVARRFRETASPALAGHPAT